jgi:hypothetical protein
MAREQGGGDVDDIRDQACGSREGRIRVKDGWVGESAKGKGPRGLQVIVDDEGGDARGSGQGAKRGRGCPDGVEECMIGAQRIRKGDCGSRERFIDEGEVIGECKVQDRWALFVMTNPSRHTRRGD